MIELSTILHVDDDSDIQDIARMALSVVDSFELHQASSGPAALEMVEQIKPDLFLFDVMMPGMSGPNLWAKLKLLPAFSVTPTIFMTAKAEGALSAELLGQEPLL